MLFTFTIIVTVVLTVLAYIKRNSVTLWIAAAFAWVYTIPLAETQLADFVRGVWRAWVGA